MNSAKAGLARPIRLVACEMRGNARSMGIAGFGPIIACALALFPCAVPAAQQLLAAQSEVAFVSRQMGVPVRGKFERFSGKVDVDPARPEGGQVWFTVDLSSVVIGTAEAVAELKKPDWFDVAKFPSATFRSSRIQSLGNGKIEVTGRLTIKGVSHEIHVPMTLVQQGGLLKVGGEFTIRRLDYRIGAGEWGDTSLVANEVVVTPRLTLKADPGP